MRYQERWRLTYWLLSGPLDMGWVRVIDRLRRLAHGIPSIYG